MSTRERSSARGKAPALCLQTVSGTQIELEPRHKYKLGRARDCDVVVEDIASSRYHARITVSAKGKKVTVEDLTSRNGTYVDNARIEGRTTLKPGSRIRIGATIYLVNHKHEGTGEEETTLHNLDTGTVGFDQLSFGQDVGEEILRVIGTGGESGSEFAGQLGAISLIEVLQLLIQTFRSGTLHVAVEGGHAEIELRDGDVCAASFDDLEGFDALMELIGKKTGLFWLVEDYSACANLIKLPGSTLLLELCRAQDEQDFAANDAFGSDDPEPA